MAHDRSAIRPQALFLDLDGTLLDESRLQEAIARTCERIAAVQPGLLASQLAEANAREWAAYWAEIEDAWTLGTLDGASVQLETWRRTLRACGCNDDSAARLAAQTFGHLSRESYALFSDVPELLKSAKRAGVRLALVTNGASDTQRERALRSSDRALVRCRGHIRGSWRSKTRSSRLCNRSHQARCATRTRVACRGQPGGRCCGGKGGWTHGGLAQPTRTHLHRRRSETGQGYPFDVLSWSPC